MAFADPIANVNDKLNDQVPFLPEILGLVITWALVLMLVRHFSRLFQVMELNSRHFKLDERALVSIDRILDTFFYTMGIFASLLILGITGALYAGLTAFGVIGLIIGFAGSEVLGNLLAGFVLILDRPFVIGDYIKVGNHEGNVRRVSLRSCEIQQGDGLFVTLPNAYMTGRPIINYTKNPSRRVEIKVGLLHMNDLGRAMALAQDVLDNQATRLQERPFQVLASEITEGSVVITCRFWVPRSDFSVARSEATLALNKLFKQEDIALAVPLLKDIS